MNLDKVKYSNCARCKRGFPKASYIPLKDGEIRAQDKFKANDNTLCKPCRDDDAGIEYPRVRQKMVKITERGWGGHFICVSRCVFRRNTLIEGDNDSVVVSTVGGMKVNGELETIGAFGRYYETMVFGAKEIDGYIEAYVSDERSLDAEWAICAENPEDLPKNVDNIANDMHEAVVREFVSKLDVKSA